MIVCYSVTACKFYTAHCVYTVGVCGSSISATIPIPDDAYPYTYLTHAENCYPTQPVGIPIPITYP